jgi:hypothetical protein
VNIAGDTTTPPQYFGVAANFAELVNRTTIPGNVPTLEPEDFLENLDLDEEDDPEPAQ